MDNQQITLITPSTPTPIMNNLGKPVIIGLAALFVIAIVALAIVVLTPGHKPSSNQASSQSTPEVNTDSLMISSLDSRVKTQDDNIKKLYSNQKKINDSIKEILTELEDLKKNQKDDRGYIATLYKKVSEIKTQVDYLGGGFNVKGKERDEVVNPLMGGGSLPSAPVPADTLPQQ